MPLSEPRVFNWPDGAGYVLRQVYTQTATGGGNIRVRITPGEGSEFIFKSLRVGPDDYGANRTGSVSIIRADSNEHFRFLSLTTIDNNTFFLPAKPADGPTDGGIGVHPEPIIISGDNALIISTFSAAVNETLTFALILRLKDELPTIVSSDSTGTVGTPTTTINKPL